jgi:hypothetical protein
VPQQWEHEKADDEEDIENKSLHPIMYTIFPFDIRHIQTLCVYINNGDLFIYSRLENRYRIILKLSLIKILTALLFNYNSGSGTSALALGY